MNNVELSYLEFFAIMIKILTWNPIIGFDYQRSYYSYQMFTSICKFFQVHRYIYTVVKIILEL